MASVALFKPHPIACVYGQTELRSLPDIANFWQVQAMALLLLKSVEGLVETLIHDSFLRMPVVSQMKGIAPSGNYRGYGL